MSVTRLLLPALLLFGAAGCTERDAPREPAADVEETPQASAVEPAPTVMTEDTIAMAQANSPPVERAPPAPPASHQRAAEALQREPRRPGPSQRQMERIARPIEQGVELAFRRIGTGIELIDDTVMLGGVPARLTVARVSVSMATLSLATTEEPKDPGHTLLGYQNVQDARVVLSGGFLKSFYPPLASGFVKSDGMVLNRPEYDPLLNGMLGIAGNRVAMLPFHGTEGTEAWVDLLQAGPLLVLEGQSALPARTADLGSSGPAFVGQRYTRAFIAVDSERRVLLGLVSDATLPDLVELLTRSLTMGGLACRAALNLSGQDSAGLLVDAEDGHVEVGNTELRLPNAIVVR